MIASERSFIWLFFMKVGQHYYSTQSNYVTQSNHLTFSNQTIITHLFFDESRNNWVWGSSFLFLAKEIDPDVKKVWSLRDRKGKHILLHKLGALSRYRASRGSVNYFPGKWRPSLSLGEQISIIDWFAIDCFLLFS